MNGLFYFKLAMIADDHTNIALLAAHGAVEWSLIYNDRTSLSIGQSGDFSISKDAGPYSCCVPLSALYSEEGKVYVYVTDTENTVLGTVMVARKVEVTVQDKNQTTAALGEGSLSTDQAVIVQADRELKDGSRVRISEN